MSKIDNKQRKLNFFNKIVLGVRRFELEKIASDESLKKKELYLILENSKKKQLKILEKIKKFWKLLKEGHTNFKSIIISLKNEES